MQCGQNVSERCGGHIHIGASYLTMEESWRNLTEIWVNSEKILFTISNKAGEIPRNGIFEYASPISRNFEEMLNSGNINIENEESLKYFVKRNQQSRYFGINFMNIGDSKDTIEFRLANGTIDADIWIQNINLFGGIVRSSEDLARIQTKPGDERTQQEKKMLEYFEQIKKSKISERDKLEALLSIIIPEEHRDIYRKRYKVNSKLIEQNSVIKKRIIENVTKSPISIKQVGRKAFLGEDGVTGQEYSQTINIIERDLGTKNSEISI